MEYALSVNRRVTKLIQPSDLVYLGVAVRLCRGRHLAKGNATCVDAHTCGRKPVESIPTTRTSLHNARFLHYLLHAAFTAFSTRYLNVMAPIDNAVAAIRASDGQKIGTVARAFGVHRTTLSRRIHS
jgi:hypothetical protein